MNKDRITELEKQLDDIKSEIEKLKSEEAHKEVKPWRAEKNVGYCFVRDIGEICSTPETGRESDYDRYKIGNYYRTCELAEQDAKELALRGRVRQLRDVLCEGYQFINDVSNWLIYFDTEDEKFYADERILCNYVGVICFDTYEHAQQACDILNKELKNGNIKI